MSTNGHISLSPEEIEQIMDEWVEITYAIRRQLHGSILGDLQSEGESAFEITMRQIQSAFTFGCGGAPNDLYAEGMQQYCLWNYPHFAQKLRERAKERNTSIRDLVKWAFSPKFTIKGEVIEEEPIDRMRRVLLREDGQKIIFKRLFGKEEP